MTATVVERVRSRRDDPAMLYLASFVVLGLAGTLLGPALPMLRESTGTSESEISVLFLWTGPAYMVTAWTVGRLYDRAWGHRLLAGGLVTIAAGALLLIVLSSSVIGLAVGFIVMGAGMSAVDVGCNALLVWSRSGDVGSIMNALHLCFGIGALIGPLSVGVSEWAHDTITIACVVVAVPALAVGAVIWNKPSPTPRAAGTSAAVTESGRTHWFGLGLVGVFFLVYVGMELGFANWITTYAEDTGIGTAPLPAVVAAMFWAGFTLCRVISVPVARRVPAVRILYVAGVAAVAGVGVMVLGDGAAATTWVGSFLFGAAVAPQYPTMVALAEERIGLSGAGTSFIVVSSAVGGLALPWLVGQMLDARGATAMPVVIAIAAVVLLGWLAVVDRGTRDDQDT